MTSHPSPALPLPALGAPRRSRSPRHHAHRAESRAAVWRHAVVRMLRRRTTTSWNLGLLDARREEAQRFLYSERSVR